MGGCVKCACTFENDQDNVPKDTLDIMHRFSLYAEYQMLLCAYGKHQTSSGQQIS